MVAHPVAHRDEREDLRTAWAELATRQKRLAAEWDETNRFHAEQAAALDARAAEIRARETATAAAHAKLSREVAALRLEAAGLEARIANARAAVDELERRRAELDAAALAPRTVPAAEWPAELLVALDRGSDRDLSALAADLERREAQLRADRADLQVLLDRWRAERAEFADRKRVLGEQFGQLVEARARWQAAERATVLEMEELARTLRAKEVEQDARAQRLARADARRREDAYELWQLRLRLEAWQAHIVAEELRWHTAREQMELEFAKRAALLPDAGADLPLARPVRDPVPAEVAGLRAELERVSVVLLEAELPEPPDPPQSELPWGAEEVPLALAVPDSEPPADAPAVSYGRAA
jgi:chromosome segregation ATPase